MLRPMIVKVERGQGSGQVPIYRWRGRLPSLPVGRISKDHSLVLSGVPSFDIRSLESYL
jgi:hypothetical protein